MKIYLAYGSNLNKRQMQLRCPGAEPKGTGFLDGFSLVFRRGFLTIEPEPGSRVPVGIWEISDQDERNLDIYEGFPRFYTKTAKTFTDDQGRTQTGLVYIMQPGHKIQAPTDGYLLTVLGGYADFGFDQRQIGRAYRAACSRRG